MKSTLYKMICLTALVVCSIFIGSTVKSTAEDKVINYSFPGVSPFNTPSGRLGFFEQGTGRIYLYDDNIKECVFIGQLKKLGEPIEKLQ
jgi:hypothetical protein